MRESKKSEGGGGGFKAPPGSYRVNMHNLVSENEYHVVMDCKIYDDIRDGYSLRYLVSPFNFVI